MGLLGLAVARAQVIPTDSLVVHYQFDGNLDDASGNNYHLTSINSLNYATVGQSPSDKSVLLGSGDRLYFDYSSAHTHFRNQEYSCMVRVRFKDFDNTYVNFMENGPSNKTTAYFRLLNAGGFTVRLQAGHYMPDVSGGSNSEPYAELDKDTWYTLATTTWLADATNVRVTAIYINGTQISQDTSFGWHLINFDPSYTLFNVAARDGASNFGISGEMNDFTYYNRALDSNEVISYHRFFEGPGLSIEEHSSLTLYPNPTSDKIRFQASSESGITLYDATGQTVYRGLTEMGQNTLDVSFLPSGIYFLQTDLGERAKFIKN